MAGRSRRQCSQRRFHTLAPPPCTHQPRSQSNCCNSTYCIGQNPGPKALWTLAEAQVTTEQWRVAFNTARPHTALGDRTPSEYADEVSSRQFNPNVGT